MTEKQYDDWKLEAPESDENAPRSGLCGKCAKFTSECPCGCGWGICAADGERTHESHLCEVDEFEAYGEAA